MKIHVGLIGLVGLVGLALAARGQVETPFYLSLREATGNAGSRVVTVTPLDGPLGFGGTNIVYSGPFELQPSSGVVATNLVMGNYRLSFAGLTKAMDIFWPADPTITNAADPRLRTTGLVRTFTLYMTNGGSGTWTGAVGVASFNSRTGVVSLTSADVTGALGYTPWSSSVPVVRSIGGLGTSVVLAWDTVSFTNEITNYLVYYGVASRTYTNSVAAGANTTATVSNLVRGAVYYFAATAVDTNGYESDYSSEVLCAIPTLAVDGANIVVGSIPTEALNADAQAQLALAGTGGTNGTTDYERIGRPLNLPSLAANSTPGEHQGGHPSVVDAGTNWPATGGHRYWLAWTPYPGQEYELPSIGYSDDLVNWFTNGITNAIFTVAEAVAIDLATNGNNGSGLGWQAGWSDVEIYLNRHTTPTSMIMMGRFIGKVLSGENIVGGNYALYYKTSEDGTNWSTIKHLCELPGSDVSTQIVDTGSNLRWYQVNQTNGHMQYFTTDYAYTNFSAVVDCGFYIWHFDIQRLGDGSYMCLGTDGYGGAVNKKMQWWTSTDGISWSQRSTDILPRSGGYEDTNGFYKADFIVNSTIPLNITLITDTKHYDADGYYGATYYGSFLLYRNIAWPPARSLTNQVGALSLNPDSISASSGRFDGLRVRNTYGSAVTITNASSTVTLPMDSDAFTVIKCPASCTFQLSGTNSDATTVVKKEFWLDGQNTNGTCQWPAAWQWIRGPGAATNTPVFGVGSNIWLTVSMYGGNVFAEARVTATLPEVEAPPEADDPDVLAFFAATGGGTADQTNAVKNLVSGLKGCGYWTNALAIYPFVGGTSNAHAVNLRQPGTFDLTWSNAVTHSARGIVGDLTNYANTGINPTAAGLAITNWYMFSYIDVWPNGNYFTWAGASDGGAARLGTMTSPNGASHMVSSMTGSAGEINLSAYGNPHVGCFLLCRPDLNNAWYYSVLNPAVVDARAASTVVNHSIYLLAYNNNGAASNFADAGLSGFAIGTGTPTYQQWTNYSAVWQTFETEMERAR